MKGSVASRRLRYARVLPAAAVMVGVLVALPSCAGKSGPEQSTPQPKDTPAPPTPAVAAQPKPAVAAQPKPAQPTPTPAPQPAQPKPVETAVKPPAVTDTAAVTKQFCTKVTSGIKGAIRSDSTLKERDAIVRKATTSIPDTMAAIVLSKNVRCN